MSTRTWGGGGFRPRTLPSKGRQLLLWIFGPLIWVGALLIGAVLDAGSGMVVIAGAIAGGTLLLAFVILLPGAVRRHRRMAGR